MNHHPTSKADAQIITTTHFLDDVEQRIVRRLHQETETKEGREELIRSTGVHDQKLIDELVKLGITADGLIALRLLPLVLVAWAEDSANIQEYEAVMEAAAHLGIKEGSSAWVLLDTWLKKRPPGLSVDAWKRHTHDIFVGMSSAAIGHLIELTEQQMTAVAKSSGGHLGFGKVSKKEQIMIDKLVAEMRRASVISNRAVQ